MEKRGYDAILEISKGRRAGHQNITIQGRNQNINSAPPTTPEDIWTRGGDYTGFDATEAQTLGVSSTSADDAAGEIGLTSLVIHGLDAGYLEISEVVVLNGVSTATTSKTFLRVNGVEGLSAGTTERNVGTITVQQTTSGIVMAEIAIDSNDSRGDSRAQQAVFTVPQGKTVFLHRFYATINDMSTSHANLAIEFRTFAGAWISAIPVGVSQNGGFLSIELPFVTIPERIDVRMRCKLVSSNDSDITAMFSFILIDNDQCTQATIAPESRRF